MRVFNAGLAVAVFALPAVSAAQAPWRQVRDPAASGYDTTAIHRALTLADSVGSAAVIAVHRGVVFAAFGDVSRPIPSHSVRKSLLGGLLGIAIARGELQLDATLASLGVDDVGALTPTELQATVGDLAATRSGVYHPAAYADASQDRERPARGAHAHGTWFFYNNWDFNVAEHVVERAGHGNLYQLYHDRLARPLGMEDYDPARDGHEVLEPSRSRYPAHTIKLSARDMARYGELIRNRGTWNGQNIVPAAWVERSLTPVSDLGEGAGYGLLWWTYAAGWAGERMPTLTQHRLVLARGTGGQAILIVPSLELVVVHRGDTENGRSVAGPPIWRMFEALASAASRAGAPGELTALAPRALASQLPAVPPLPVVAMDRAMRARFIGNYLLGGATPVRVYEYEERLFVDASGMGEGEVVALSPTQLAMPGDRSVRIDAETDATGRVVALRVIVDGQSMRAERR
jgi:CubicO group peptidase (beta-lactamase class C family)